MVILMPYLRYVATDPRVYVINGEKTSTVLNILRSRPSNSILISNELAGILNCQIFISIGKSNFQKYKKTFSYFSMLSNCLMASKDTKKHCTAGLNVSFPCSFQRKAPSVILSRFRGRYR